ncbi:hypothetical protein NFI95_07300 [Acetobacteraceae bacterium KSS8]|uniref:Uncharacterized protein n=1 Tax=Endosaccharibacter trunci TaxID=2812733 RepID=A0ABT1W8V1_9PROT|nr:hypothetical protein [Acetobacteraceae bacterium KSS8]
MTVGYDYMLKKGAGPSAPKVFFDTKIVPAIVNMLGAGEVALDTAARRLRVRPSVLLGGAGAVLGVAVLAASRR